MTKIKSKVVRVPIEIADDIKKFAKQGDRSYMNTWRRVHRILKNEDKKERGIVF